MVVGGADGHALDTFDVVTEPNELHLPRLDGLFGDGLADSEHDLHAALLLDDAQLAPALSREIAAEAVVQVQVHLLVLLLHFKL